jgi:hypothetical protein
MKKGFIFFIILIALQNAKAQKDSSFVELSFGGSLLFISDTKLQSIQNKVSVIVPTNAALFYATFRPNKKLKIPVFGNIPYQTKQYIVNGQLVESKASPTLGTGVEFRTFKFNFLYNSEFEINAGPVASFLLTENNKIRFAPVLASRLRIVKGGDFSMYIGTSYSIGINSWGIFYGTGFVF